MKSEIFNEEQIKVVYNSVEMAEEIVSGYYKMSPTQWLRNRYDVKTFVDLKEGEKVVGPFAQIIKYSGKRNNSHLGSEIYDLYRICIQDSSIIDLVTMRSDIILQAFMLYIITHELIHVVRFGQFEQFFHVNEKQRLDEEVRVHRMTHKILSEKKIEGLAAVLAYYIEAVL